MTSAATESSTKTSSSKELAPTFDFAQAEVALKKDPNLNLTEVLAQLATLPPVAKEKRPKPPTAVELVTDGLMKAIKALPDVFGQVKLRGRRQLTKAEIATLEAEKEEIDAAIKALGKRKDEIHVMISVHLDVSAEKKKLVTEETPQDNKGHYLIAAPGNPEIIPIEGSSRYFTREKASDKVTLSMDKLLALYESGGITRAEFLGFTKRTDAIDEEKIRRRLLNKAKAARTREIIEQIKVVTPGRLSINLRGK